MRTITVLGAASALFVSGCALEEARPNQFGPGDLSPVFGGEVDSEGTADAAGSDASALDALGGLDVGEPIVGDLVTQYDAMVLIGSNGGSELVQVSRDGTVTPRALPPELSSSEKLLADGSELLLGSTYGYFTRLLPSGQTLPTGINTYYEAAISAPGEVTVPDEFRNTTYDIETGETIATVWSDQTCWMSSGDRAGGGMLAADMFSDTIYAFAGGSLSGEPLGASLGWYAKIAEGSDGEVWQGEWNQIRSDFGVDAQSWSTDDEIVALVPLGSTVAFLLETMSSSRDSRLSVFTEAGEEVVATFPNAVLYDAAPLAR